MDERRDDFPRLADAYSGDGFPEHGPWTPLSDAVIDDALERLRNIEYGAEHNDCPACRAKLEQLKAQTRAAKEIEAAHADPHWLDGH